MPKKKPINSVPTALDFLTKTSGTYLNTPNAADRVYSVTDWIDLNPADPASPHSRFVAAHNFLQNCTATQSARVLEANRISTRLAMYISHFHQELDNAIQREELPSGPGARAYYGRTIEAGPIPDPRSGDDLEKEAKNIVSGEARRLAAEGQGAVDLKMPTAAQVGALGDELHDARQLVQQATTAVDNAKEALGRLTAPVLALCAKSVARIELHFMDDPSPSSFRAKCIRWGVVYLYDEGETPDDPPAPTPPNP